MARLPVDVSVRIQWVGCSGRLPNFCLPHPKQFGETLGRLQGASKQTCKVRHCYHFIIAEGLLGSIEV